MRSVAIIAASLIGLSMVGAFASGVHRHRGTAAGVATAGTVAPGTSAGRADNTLSNGDSSVGSYCPIPARGLGDKGHTTALATRLVGDSLLLAGQSVAPDTANARCSGTAVPTKRP